TFKLSWDAKKLWYFGIPACTVVGILAEGWMRRGSPFLTGYEGNRGFQTLLPYSGLPGFSYPLILGILSILFSFGKGLLFFTPGLVLVGNEAERISPGAKLRQLQQLLLLFTFGMVLVYAKWWAWYGGWFWGPRFFLFASVPASLALAVQLERPHDFAWKNIFVLAILLLSAWVGVDGALFGQDGLEVGTANNYALESLIWYVPEFSPLWHPFIARRRLVPRDWAV